ncbi:MAG: preprotein translocase subunit SecD [Candidatus Saccharimonadales bacterium]
MKKLRKHLILLTVFSLLVIGLALPREDALLKAVGIDQVLSVRQGLDLQGGAHLTYEADFTSVPEDRDREEILENTAQVIERRINPTGTSEAKIQTAAGGRIIVQLPGVEDVEEAKTLIGQTAQLRFLEAPSGFESIADFTPTEITGEDVNKAQLGFDPTTGEPIVELTLKSGASTGKFAELTTRLANQNGFLLTVLDTEIVFGPASTVPITNGVAVLSGNFTVQGANDVEDLINGGALPVDINPVSESTVGPELGQEAVNKSLLAALIGLGSMAIFLVIYYRLGGVGAVLAIVIYMSTTLAIYKLSALTPYVVVLTLGGIAGFILSVAMAADANILILERTKEEVARGIGIKEALEDGFNNAWSSIRDASSATIIGATVLYYFGTTLIKGFAVTLGIGVLLSVFSAAFISRTILRVLVRRRFFENQLLSGMPIKDKK